MQKVKLFCYHNGLLIISKVPSQYLFTIGCFKSNLGFCFIDKPRLSKVYLNLFKIHSSLLIPHSYLLKATKIFQFAFTLIIKY